MVLTYTAFIAHDLHLLRQWQKPPLPPLSTHHHPWEVDIDAPYAHMLGWLPHAAAVTAHAAQREPAALLHTKGQAVQPCCW